MATSRLIILLLVFIFLQCARKDANQETSTQQDFVKGQFGYDLKFLKKYHPDLVLLGEDSTAAQLIVLPAYQGRVMTSTADGFGGASFGWVNHDLIASAKMQEHINVFGGEERFWLGPEGGQYSIYFKKGVPFTFDNWFVPKELDTESFTLVSATKTEAKFEKEMHLENYSGNTFDLKVNRNIRLLDRDGVMALLNTDFPADVKVVAFESENILSNAGTNAWTKDTGLLSIWILSMLNASDSGVVAIPFKKGTEKELGKIVTDTYFGKVPADRLKVKDGLMVFKADAAYRSKVGISPQRAVPWVCSYDAQNQVLTLAQFTLPAEANDYVNSLWEQQKEPYRGDAVNSYNDGPLENERQLGKFYEIESSSPAAALKPGESIKHIHRTIHIQGSKASLEKIVSQALSIKLSDISFQ
jgi:hypothetical protein